MELVSERGGDVWLQTSLFTTLYARSRRLCFWNGEGDGRVRR